MVQGAEANTGPFPASVHDDETRRTGPRYQRIGHIKALMAAGLLAEDLRHCSGATHERIADDRVEA